MKANATFEAYEAFRDATDAAGHTASVRDSGTKLYKLQRELYDTLKEVTYNADDSLKSRVDFDSLNAGEYREHFGWSFEAFEDYRKVPADFLPDVVAEMLPREDDQREDFDQLRLPTYEGDVIPIVVESEEELKEAKRRIKAAVRKVGPVTPTKETTEIETTGLSETLQELPGVGEKNGKEIAQELQDRPELIGAILDEIESVETYSITNDPIKRFSGEQREMAETLREAGHTDREIIRQLA